MKKFGCSQKKNLFEIITSELDFIIKKHGLKPKFKSIARGGWSELAVFEIIIDFEESEFKSEPSLEYFK